MAHDKNFDLSRPAQALAWIITEAAVDTLTVEKRRAATVPGVDTEQYSEMTHWCVVSAVHDGIPTNCEISEVTTFAVRFSVLLILVFTSSGILRPERAEIKSAAVDLFL